MSFQVIVIWMTVQTIKINVPRHGSRRAQKLLFLFQVACCWCVCIFS
jgi:hypothetical protein